MEGFTTYCDVATERESDILGAKDPLEDVNCIDAPIYYRLNETIFAEPIVNINTSDVSNGDKEEILFMDKVMVQKKNGKRHKYLIDMDKNSSNPKCPQSNCQKTFSTMILLRAHIRKVHCAERKFICEHCASAFSAKYLLERHMAVHTLEKVECPMCGKMLSKRTNMSVHLKWHADTREHACPICSRDFVRRATLLAHMRRVHADKAAARSECEKAAQPTLK